MALKRSRHELTVACDFCAGAGVIVDAFDKTTGVVCAGCGGKGYRKLDYEPFDRRKKIPGLKKVRWAGAGIVPFSTTRKRPIVTITYAEFLKGKLP